MITPLIFSLAALGLVIAMMLLASIGQVSNQAHKLASQPAVAVLSVGVITAGTTNQLSYMSAASTQHGVFFLFFGLSLMFLTAPLLLKPIYHCVRKYNFEHIVDMLAFRFRANNIGRWVSALIIVAALPLLAAQLQALSETINVATQHRLPLWQASGLLMLPVLLFIVVLHSHRTQPRKRNSSLILIAALDTILRIVALYSLGWFGYQSTGVISPELFEPTPLVPMNTDQTTHSVATIPPIIHGASNLVLFAFTLSACLPQVFKFTFSEKPARPSIDTMTWAVPLLLLVLSLPFYTIINTLQNQAITHNPYDYMAQLALSADSPWLTFLVLISALSGFLCTTLILVGSCTSQAVNYWVLPQHTQHNFGGDIYRWLRSTRRFIAMACVAVIWLLTNILSPDDSLFLSTEIAPALLIQLFPGLVCCVLFAKPSSQAFSTGLGAGVATTIIFGLPEAWLSALTCAGCDTPIPTWLLPLNQHTIVLSLALNSLLLWLVTQLKPAEKKDYVAAGLMLNRHYQQPEESNQSPYTVQDFITALVPLVGVKEAEKHVDQAIQELKITKSEQRPYILIQLHHVVERNLSRSLGDSVAQKAISQLLPYSLSRMHRVSMVDQRINEFQSGFSGIAGELDKLRRFHRNTLAKLPVGVCFINVKREILLWNESLARISQLKAGQTEGKYLRQLPAPWSQLLTQFIRSEDSSRKLTIGLGSDTRWIQLHKDTSLENEAHKGNDNIIVVEDITEVKILEDELIHRERLASIGSLAAGVAHEIGNPVTGIACLAQNIELDTDEPELLETAQEIIRQTERISAIMRNLVGFSHAGRAHVDIKQEAFYLTDCINDATKLLTLDKSATQVHFKFDDSLREQTAMMGDPQRIQQVFVNLFSNARDASQAGDNISTVLTLKDQHMEITVTDQGTGIPPAVRDKIFEPFFTTKQVGQGTGLGLALVFGIIEEHAGTIRVNSPVMQGRGTRFTVTLPRKVQKPRD